MDTPCDVYIERIDDEHSDAGKLWAEIGSPALASPREVEQMRAASQVSREPLLWKDPDNTLHLSVTMPAHAIGAIWVALSLRIGQ